MKVDSRAVEEMKFFIHTPSHAEPIPVEINTFINDMQILNLSMDPRSIKDFSKFLEKEAKSYGSVDPQIKAVIIEKYNGRTGVPFVDPDINLAEVPYQPFEKLDWVYPLPGKK